MMKCKKCERSVPIWAKADENMCAEHSYERLNEENKRLKERIEFAVDYLPESPNKAIAFLTPALKGEVNE